MMAPIDPCESVASPGTARIYALDYTTGNAVYDFDKTSVAIGKPDRFTVIGGSIPSGVVFGLIRGLGVAKVGIVGSIRGVEAGTSGGLFSIFWRQMF